MRSESYHERLWESVPEGIEPPDFALRRRVPPATMSAADRARARRRLRRGSLHRGARRRRRAGRWASTSREEPLRRARAPATPIWSSCGRCRSTATGRWRTRASTRVWAGEVIEHVADTAGWLSELRRVLRPGGLLLLSTPNHGRSGLLTMALFPRSFEAHFDPLSDHLRFYTRRSLARVPRGVPLRGDPRLAPPAGFPGARRLLLASARRARW